MNLVLWRYAALREKNSFVFIPVCYQKIERVFGSLRLTSDFCLAYLIKTPLFSLSCVIVNCITCANVTDSALRLHNSQKETTNFHDHFAKGEEIKPVTTIEVVLERIRGYVWSPFLPTLIPTMDSFCFKGLDDDSARTSDSTDPQLCFCQIEIAPILNLGGEEMGVGGSERDDFFFNGRRRFFFNGTMHGSATINNGWTVDSGGMGQQCKSMGFN